MGYLSGEFGNIRFVSKGRILLPSLFESAVPQPVAHLFVFSFSPEIMLQKSRLKPVLVPKAR